MRPEFRASGKKRLIRLVKLGDMLRELMIRNRPLCSRSTRLIRRFEKRINNVLSDYERQGAPLNNVGSVVAGESA